MLQFAQALKKYREKSGESITEAANNLGVDRSYLSKLENGHEKPSFSLFNLIISHFSIPKDEAFQLASLVYNPKTGLVLMTKRGEEVNNKMEDKQTQIQNQPQGVNVNLAADKVSILYTDSVFITSNPYGIVFNVAQSIDEKNQQIVARIGMSRDHAKALAEVLAKHLAMTLAGKSKQ